MNVTTYLTQGRGPFRWEKIIIWLTVYSLLFGAPLPGCAILDLVSTARPISRRCSFEIRRGFESQSPPSTTRISPFMYAPEIIIIKYKIRTAPIYKLALTHEGSPTNVIKSWKLNINHELVKISMTLHVDNTFR